MDTFLDKLNPKIVSEKLKILWSVSNVFILTFVVYLSHPKAWTDSQCQERFCFTY